MSKSQYDLVAFCASKMGLRFTKVKDSVKNQAFLRRNINSHDTLKMLQFAPDGKSGRYMLVRISS